MVFGGIAGLLLLTIGSVVPPMKLVSAAPPAHALPFEFTNITTSDISPYNHINPSLPTTWKNDVSGAAHIGELNIVADDLLSAVRIWKDGMNEASEGVMIPYHREHKDVEGATQLNDQLIVTCSMTHLTDERFNLLSRYDVDSTSLTLMNGVSVNMRSRIMSAIGNSLGQEDPTWFTRIQTFGEKDGNLNIEGISTTAPGSYYELVWGVRGPLYGPDFAKFATIAGKQVQLLETGEALVIFVHDAFGVDPQFRVETLDLQGKGIRSIEYIPSLHGYLIVSGPVPKADNYRLWLWRPAPGNSTGNGNGNGNNQVLVDITDKLPSFTSLGRPEAIMNRAIKRVNIFSEEDPTFTINPPFNMIQADIELGTLNN